MPQNHNYTSVLPLISSPRLKSYQDTFETTSDYDLYGVYIWAQHASASLYPLAHNLEITLRNSIDVEATKRFGSFWWSQIAHANNKQSSKFFDNIDAAKGKLKKEWEKKTRARLGLKHWQQIPAHEIMPIWTHDQLIAATDFSTWQFILLEAFNSPHKNQNGAYLWPDSLSKVFRNHIVIHHLTDKARKDLIDLVNELREYRNRLFHHEPIWTKGPAVTDARSAIDTVRTKINRIELLLKAIGKGKFQIMRKLGVFDHARRICSEAELSIYRYNFTELVMTDEQKQALSAITGHVGAKNETAAWTHNGAVYGVHKIR